MQSGKRNLAQDVLMVLLLCALTLCVFAQVRSFAFVSLDDSDIVEGNPNILPGLTWSGMKWAFTHGHYGIWMPLTSISHMLDVSLFGLNPGGHHLSSLAIHLCNVILLYFAMRMLTGEPLKAAFVAALIAIHPMRAEAVAWVSSRKEILAGTFWFLTLIAYAWYARRPGVWRYLLLFAAFVLGLMAKPITITLPFLLLLLDYWPLRRLDKLSWAAIWRRVGEKLPLIAATIPVMYVAVRTQADLGALVPAEGYPLGARLAQTPVNYALYLYHMVAPIRLACYYQHPFVAPPLWETLLALAILLAISGAVLLAWKRLYLFVGWFWFVGTIVPVSGLVQVSSHTVADRYSYSTLVGLNIMLAWGIADLVGACVTAPLWRRRILCGLGLGSLAIFAGLGWWQVSYYSDSERLFRRTLDVTGRNHYAQGVMGNFAYDRGEYREAEHHFRKALEALPGSAKYRYNLGVTLLKMNRWAEAAQLLETVVKATPEDAEPHVDLAVALWNLGQKGQAMDLLAQATRLEPDNAPAHMNYGICLLMQGRAKEAETELLKASELDPGNTYVQENLAKARQAAP